MCAVSPIPETWPTDRINIEWKHAVNSKELLDKAINSNAQMIEADVSLNNSTTPIMAHPPKTVSDLTLNEFIGTVMKMDTKKGVKLDFKSYKAFNASIEVLKSFNIMFPLWLNADILEGPQGGNNTVEAEKFLTEATKQFPDSLLSLGWTTKNGSITNSTDMQYTEAQIKEMVKKAEKVENKQSITYAMRACLLEQTKLELVQTLLKKPNTTLTVWSAEEDVVDAEKLFKMIKEVGLSKVFVDVSSDLREKLIHLKNSGTMKNISMLSVMSSILFALLVTQLSFK